MTNIENKVYTLVDDCCDLTFKTGNLLHCIRYDPEGATAEDAKRLQKIRKLLTEALALADATDLSIHGEPNT